MTDREKAIVMAYTGVTMLAGEKFNIFHKYVEEIMERPVQTLELAFNAEEIKRRATPDFLSVCSNDNVWFDIQEKEPEDHCFVLVAHADYRTPMRAKFHVGEGFEVIGHYFVCLEDDRIKYWTYLPNMPVESGRKEDG